MKTKDGRTVPATVKATYIIAGRLSFYSNNDMQAREAIKERGIFIRSYDQLIGLVSALAS